MRALAALAVLAGCADKPSKTWFTDGFFSAWDDRRVLCSMGGDASHSWPMSNLYDALDRAVDERLVVHTYGHAPGLDLDEYAPVFEYAHQRGIELVTYSQLVDRSDPRPAWAFSIDDADVDTWVTWRDRLHAAGVHFTFFVSMWDTLTDAQRADLVALHDDGHDIEPHGMHHFDAPAYPSAPGYATDEVEPELAGLVAAGYTPTTFAYPFGHHTPETDAAILRDVAIIRTATAAACDVDADAKAAAVAN
jgi:peptidoglycan/xylan/chitin deacetylase (PgdA/CDA1 family)